MPLAEILALVLAVGGVWIAASTMRSALRRPHPKCARCGYDLGGVRDAGVPLERCSECGADLSAAASVVTSRRRLRVGVALAVFSVAVLLGGPPAARLLVQRWPGPGAWLDKVPEAPLTWLARAGDGELPEAARTEIARRMRGNQLSQCGFDRILRFTLPGDAAAGDWIYRPEWDEATRLAIVFNQVRSSDARAYMEGAFAQGTQASPSIETTFRPGKRADLRVWFEGWKPFMDIEVESVSLDDRDVLVRSYTGAGNGGRARATIMVPADTLSGEHDLLIKVRGVDQPWSNVPDRDEPLTASFIETITVEGGEPAVKVP